MELLAYFFLRLYKANLAEVKYFQNELTNVELQYMAICSAFGLADEQLRRTVVEQLCRTERNFVLKSGETTIDLEHKKIERGTFADVTKSISELIQAARK